MLDLARLSFSLRTYFSFFRYLHYKMSIDVLPSCSTTFYDPTDKTGRHLAESKQYNRRSSKSSSHGKYETTFVQNTVALAVIRKLQHWCCQLFWLTIVCVIGIGCGELNSSKQKTLKDVNRRCKTLTDLELQVNFCLPTKSHCCCSFGGWNENFAETTKIPIRYLRDTNTWRPSNKQQQLNSPIKSSLAVES